MMEEQICRPTKHKHFIYTFGMLQLALYLSHCYCLPLDETPTTQSARTTTQQTVLASDQPQPVVLASPVAAPTIAEKTADLSVLINETLAINKKGLSDSKLITLNPDEQWTFDRVEYDLMEFLQDLSARYKNCNESSTTAIATTTSTITTTPTTPTPSNPLSVFVNEETPLDAKKIITNQENSTNVTSGTTTTSSSSSNAFTSESPASTSKNTVEPEKPKVEQVNNTNNTNNMTLTSTPLSTGEPTTKISALNSTVKPTEIPQLQTSLASGDSEIAESSWQYGIFDRFTRPKTTSTTSTTREPHYDSDAKIDLRSFNTEECGLREYDEPQPQHFQEVFDLGVEASKELNQRRQRPSNVLLASIGHPKKNHMTPSDIDDRISDEHDAYESYKNHLPSALEDKFGAESEEQEGPMGSFVDDQHSQVSSSSSSSNHNNDKHQSNQHDADLNLASRRHWLQQQLERTLELLGFNASAQSAAEFLNQTSGLSLNTRENMMKKSGKLGKSALGELNSMMQLEGKSVAEVTSTVASKLLNPNRQDDMKLEARVIGGSDARLGDSPWSVSLQALVSKPGTVGVEYRHYCGGTIISDYYVLTAAHCLDFMVGRESRLFVVVGDLNWRMNAASLYGRRFGIEKLIIHSGYKSTAFGHDIGLIKTKESMRPLKVNGKYIINSVCLPEKGIEHSGEAELVGWGLFSNRNEMADTLQVADVPILPRSLCVDLYKRRTGLIQWLIGIELITDKQVCAGTFGRGICQGDSGSALVVNEKFSRRHTVVNHNNVKNVVAKTAKRLRSAEQTRATIIGIVAFGGIRRCSYQSLPGVYMQTSKYMDWILPRMQ